MRKKYCISTGIEERGTVHHTDPGQKKSAVTGAGNSETASLLWNSIAGKTVIHITADLRGAVVWKEEAVWTEEKVSIDYMPAETAFKGQSWVSQKKGGGKSRPLVNADPCLVINRSFEAFFLDVRFQVSGVRVKGYVENEVTNSNYMDVEDLEVYKN